MNILSTCGIISLSSLTSTLVCHNMLCSQPDLSQIYNKSIDSVVTIHTGFGDNKGIGSGFFYQGVIVTNAHVVDGEEVLRVEPEIDIVSVHIDRLHDVALLQVAPSKGSVAPFRECTTAVTPGQDVIAIGSPFGLDKTLTTGIVSGLDRELGELGNAYLEHLIQVDAPINPGNSGGPLLDAHTGCIIGMNTAIISPTGTNAGIGMAIPMSSIDKIIERLHDGRIVLGVALRGDGSIYEVIEGSIADHAGLMEGDTIVKINSRHVTKPIELLKRLDELEKGDEFVLEVIRKSGIVEELCCKS